MVDRYYRTIEDVENDIENAMQISSILLKLKGYDEKLEGLSKIEDNENNISSNSSKINTNTSNIDEINSNLSNIDFNSGNKFLIENFFIYNIVIEKSYKINKDNSSFSIFKYTLEDDFKKDSILEIDCRLLYQYHDYNHIGLLKHIFKLYDNNDNMFYDYKSLVTNAGDNKRNDIKQNEVFYAKLNNDYKIIKIELILSLIDGVSDTTIVDCKLYNTYKSNFLCIKHYKKINLISVYNNLTDIENDVLSNKYDITNLKNNKIYLKNLENLIFRNYNYTISYNKNIPFYNKSFNFSFKKMISLNHILKFY